MRVRESGCCWSREPSRWINLPASCLIGHCSHQETSLCRCRRKRARKASWRYLPWRVDVGSYTRANTDVFMGSRKKRRKEKFTKQRKKRKQKKEEKTCRARSAEGRAPNARRFRQKPLRRTPGPLKGRARGWVDKGRAFARGQDFFKTEKL